MKIKYSYKERTEFKAGDKVGIIANWTILNQVDVFEEDFSAIPIQDLVCNIIPQDIEGEMQEWESGYRGVTNLIKIEMFGTYWNIPVELLYKI